ncbi:YfcE family phosphodiesterase [Anaerococcus sp. AGMB00486]|uniref:Phosphoesterase n=2 Tax=Anaerococcus TaxID=165779 RepID=A0ABX2N7J8_9FIRM|nr:MULTISPECIES: YfcE family phosphodiesterase [Anaerococcus]MDY3006254.1 YfcE family phosphodiesterase [Anaerococcus porci]MSS76866.1 YfcE family phosphodiesterase [Anaerococcus porci]NVF10650.1 YfcE family phosphodiesterase [Anaerococcus faecalis]
MKVLVVSDTHGYVDDVLKFLNTNKVNLIIHAGDFSEDALKIKSISGIKTLRVKGNNDYLDNTSPDQRIINIYNHRILLVHGHKENVYYSKNSLIDKAIENECEMVIFGHTHTYCEDYDENFNIILLNPGSVSLPRDMIKSMAMIEINDYIKIKKICIN